MKENPYYSKTGLVSNSSLKALLKHPLKFKEYLDGTAEQIDTKSTELGSLVHMYLLENELFNSTITVLDYDTPNSPAKIKFCGNIQSKQKPLDAYKDAYSTKESDEKVEEKALKLKNECKSYLKYLKLSASKPVISTKIFNNIKSAAESVKAHKMASKLIFNDPEIGLLENIDYYNEYAIYFTALEVECKALLDRLIVDKDKKKITLVDIKTTFEMGKFKDSFEKYRYDIQMSFYSLAILKHLEFLTGQTDVDAYTFEVFIVVIDTSTYEVKVLDISDTILLQAANEISNLLETAKYHIDNNKWDYSKEYYEGNGTESL